MFESAQINQRLTDRLKRIVRKYSLIDTGQLYRSIQVVAEVDNTGNIYIKVYSVDYLKYNWDRFPLAADFQYARGFDRIISDLMSEWAEYTAGMNPDLAGFLDVLGNVRRYIDIQLMN